LTNAAITMHGAEQRRVGLWVDLGAGFGGCFWLWQPASSGSVKPCDSWSASQFQLSHGFTHPLLEPRRTSSSWTQRCACATHGH
jgi:hypothetical protein